MWSGVGPVVSEVGKQVLSDRLWLSGSQSSARRYKWVRFAQVSQEAIAAALWGSLFAGSLVSLAFAARNFSP